MYNELKRGKVAQREGNKADGKAATGLLDKVGAWLWENWAQDFAKALLDQATDEVKEATRTRWADFAWSWPPSLTERRLKTGCFCHPTKRERGKNARRARAGCADFA